MDSSTLTALALFGLAAVFVLAEAVFGSDGSMLILAGVAAIGGFVFMLRSNWLPGDVAWWAYPSIAVGGVVAVSVVGIYLFPQSAIGENLLREPDEDEVAPFAPDDGERLQYIGRRGKTLTIMNPGGLVLLDGNREHAESEGAAIDVGETIEVIDLRGHRLVVRSIVGTEVGMQSRPGKTGSNQPSPQDRTQDRTV